MTQTTLQFTGKQLRDKGIDQALNSADQRHGNWKHTAYAFLIGYIRTHDRFMTEQVREASKGIVPNPPSNRAWGGIITRAVREKLIRRVGFKSVKNPKAHATPATVWEKRRGS